MVSSLATSTNHFVTIVALSHRNVTTNGTLMDISQANAALNVLLTGIVISCLLMTIICVCYLCHWNMSKSPEPSVRFTNGGDSWTHLPQADTPVHIFTLDQQMDYEGESTETCELPPPSYDEVIKEPQDDDLPSYETAIKLSAGGYV